MQKATIEIDEVEIKTKLTGNLAKDSESTQQKHQNTSPKPRIEFLYENETRETISCA